MYEGLYEDLKGEPPPPYLPAVPAAVVAPAKEADTANSLAGDLALISYTLLADIPICILFCSCIVITLPLLSNYCLNTSSVLTNLSNSLVKSSFYPKRTLECLSRASFSTMQSLRSALKLALVPI